ITEFGPKVYMNPEIDIREEVVFVFLYIILELLLRYCTTCQLRTSVPKST
ncbi:uncharacterized protein LY89DRAFT_689025, partial [Mollisia scopiformis]